MKSKTDTWLWNVCPSSQKLAMQIKDEAIIVELYIMKFDNTMQFFPQFANRDKNYPDKASWMSFQTSDLLQATNCVIKSQSIAPTPNWPLSSLMSLYWKDSETSLQYFISLWL